MLDNINTIIQLQLTTPFRRVVVICWAGLMENAMANIVVMAYEATLLLLDMNRNEWAPL